jgi:hypothetical protein
MVRGTSFSKTMMGSALFALAETCRMVVMR